MSTLSNAFPWRILLVVIIFVSASSWLYFLVLCAPSIGHYDSASRDLRFPSDLSQLKKLAQLMQLYHAKNSLYVVVLFSSAYLYKQSFAIPGSVFMNLLGGALFGPWIGFVFCCLLTATGATFCYLLAKFCGKKYIERYMANRVEQLKTKIKENESSLIYILLFLRLFPITPNWFLNMASPVIDIPIDLFFISVFIGLMPYNYICVQTGCLLAQLNSLDDILTMSTIIKLSLIALAVVLPGFVFRKKKKPDKPAEKID